MELIDIGINLGHDSYDADRAAVLARAAAAGVHQMVVTGASVEGTLRAVELSRGSPQMLRATAGCHPHHASELTAGALLTLETCARESCVAAIGECGLDYFRDFSPRELQRRAFIAQLDIAARLGKPLFLHQRDAHQDFFAIVREHWPRLRGGVAHCFTSGAAELEAYLELGLHIGITGWICDERRGQHLPALMRMIPAGRLMLETDGPYLLPRDLQPKPRSRRNEPMYLAHIGTVIAAARGESLQELAAHTTATAQRFFSFPQL
jgi:TatD DNase family protein